MKAIFRVTTYKIILTSMLAALPLLTRALLLYISSDQIPYITEVGINFVRVLLFPIQTIGQMIIILGLSIYGGSLYDPGLLQVLSVYLPYFLLYILYVYAIVCLFSFAISLIVRKGTKYFFDR